MEKPQAKDLVDQANMSTRRKELGELQRNLYCPEALWLLQKEVKHLQNQHLSAEMKNYALQEDIEKLSETHRLTIKCLAQSRTALGSLSDGLVELQQVLFQTDDGEKRNSVGLPLDSKTEDTTEIWKSLSALSEAVEMRNYIDKVANQLDGLKVAVKDKICVPLKDSNREKSTEDVADLQDQVMKLTSMMSTKREQIASLRTILKLNKSTGDQAMANLKAKHEIEKQSLMASFSKLREELKVLKEDAATFSSLRMTMTARVQEYEMEVSDLRMKLALAEEGKKTLLHVLKK